MAYINNENGPIDYSQDYSIPIDYIDGGQTYPVDEVPISPPQSGPTSPTVNTDNFALGEITPQYVNNFAYLDKTSVGAKFVSILGNRKMYMGGALRLDLNQPEYNTNSIGIAGAGRDTLILNNDVLTTITILIPNDELILNPINPTDNPNSISTPSIPTAPLPVYAFLRTENLTNQNLNANGTIKGDVVVYFCNTSYFSTDNLVNCDSIVLSVKEDILYNGNVSTSTVKTFNLINVNRVVLYSQINLAINLLFGVPPMRAVFTIQPGNGYIVV